MAPPKFGKACADGARNVEERLRTSDPFYGKGRIEPANFADIAGDDDRPLAPRGQYDAGVDDVRSSGATAKDTSGLGHRLIERRNRGRFADQQGPECHLANPVTPHLPQDAGGNDESRARPQGLSTERSHARVSAFERDESACI